MIEREQTSDSTIRSFLNKHHLQTTVKQVLRTIQGFPGWSTAEATDILRLAAVCGEVVHLRAIPTSVEDHYGHASLHQDSTELEQTQAGKPQD